tara:strand:+ start:205 stop:312 length:108 start_codon:yes stop_codon:yes gene_type:complete
MVHQVPLVLMVLLAQLVHRVFLEMMVLMVVVEQVE